MAINGIGANFTNINNDFYIQTDIKKAYDLSQLQNNDDLKKLNLERNIRNDEDNVQANNNFIRNQENDSIAINAFRLREEDAVRTALVNREVVTRRAADEIRRIDTEKLVSQELAKKRDFEELSNTTFNPVDTLELSDNRSLSIRIAESLLSA